MATSKPVGIALIGAGRIGSFHAKRLAKLGVGKATTDIDAVSSDPAGKAVFVEKPMALTIADAERATATAEKAGVVLQVGFSDCGPLIASWSGRHTAA